MTSRLATSATTTAALLFAALHIAAAPADAQRRARQPKLTEETVAEDPIGIFDEKQKRRFGYPEGVDVSYFTVDGNHRWKLAERSASDATPTPTPTPEPTPVEGEDGAPSQPAATPEPEPTALPTPEPRPLATTEAEVAFHTDVALVRPTIVTMVFTESNDQARQMLDELMADKKVYFDWSSAEAEEPEEKKDDKDEEVADGAPTPTPTPYRPPIAVFKLENDRNVSRHALVYNREFNLGRAGGMRRASLVAVARGNILLTVDARKGLRDGEWDAGYDRLEKRAKSVAAYLLKKM